MDCLANRTAELNATDWESIVQFAVIYSVAPLLYHRIKSVNIPASFQHKLLKAYLISASRNTRLYSELSKIIKALQDTPVIVLKGAHLAQNVYGNIALRPMNDIDILVRKTDLLKAEKNMLEIGYSSPRQNEIQVACAKHHHLPPLIKQGRVPVDIHWTIGHPSSQCH
ncbi:MAG: nucleotidyltransferase family protein [Pseudomonadota bacterium]